MLKGLLGLHALFDRDLDPERQSDRGCYFAGHSITASAIVLLLRLKKKKTNNENEKHIQIVKLQRKIKRLDVICFVTRQKSVEVPLGKLSQFGLPIKLQKTPY